MYHPALLSFFFFFNDTATTEIYTLSLHDALPIWNSAGGSFGLDRTQHCHSDNGVDFSFDKFSRERSEPIRLLSRKADRKSTRLNSSHSQISYAVFCLKKKQHPGPARVIARVVTLC